MFFPQTLAVTLAVGLGIGTGLKAELFDNADLTVPKLTRTDMTVNSKFIKGAPASKISSLQLAQAISGKTYYVSGEGNDKNNGLTESTAFRTLQTAADKVAAGDTVYVMNGTYTQEKDPSKSILIIYQKQGTSDAPITFKAYPGHKPALKSSNMYAILICGSSYINIEGLTLVGSNDKITLKYAQEQKKNLKNPLTYGLAIVVVPLYVNGTPKYYSHHIGIRNNNISKFGGGGVNTLVADYVTIENNVISETSLYSPMGVSAISTLHNWNADNNTTEYKMIIRGNVVHNNINHIPWHLNKQGKVSEGHGIIVDDSMNTQGASTHQLYTGKTLIANNIVYKNGGCGIVVYRSTNVDVVNNTTYQNGQSPDLQNISGEIDSIIVDRVKVFNNIIYAKKNGIVNNTSSLNNTATYDNNLVYNSLKYAKYFMGLSNIVGKDPQFVNPDKGNFSLKYGSPAIDAGTPTFNGVKAPKIDQQGITRPLDGDGNGIALVDIGALERQP